MSSQSLHLSRKAIAMSDYEDDMDVDATPAKESNLFNSDNTNAKGKRSSANLPVEAEDSLPW
jgi:replication factor C subunit 3/5